MANGRTLVWYGPRDPHKAFQMRDISLHGIHTDAMPTAIVMVHTHDGFVAASDGKGNRSGRGTSLCEQKIFPIVGRSWNLVYGVAAAASLLDDDGKDIFKEEYRRAIDALQSKEDLADLGKYATAFITIVGNRIYSHFLDVFRQNPNIESYSLNFYFAGYFKDVPSLSKRELSFRRDGFSVRRMSDSHPAYPSECFLVGSEEITERILMTDEFHQFKTTGFTKLKQRDKTISLEEAVQAAKTYIEACSTKEARKIDPSCETIGGRISIATITPTKGFDWRILPA